MIFKYLELQEKKKREAQGKSTEDASETKEEEKEDQEITLRALNMEDMRQAKNQVTNLTFFQHFASINYHLFYVC